MQTGYSSSVSRSRKNRCFYAAAPQLPEHLKATMVGLGVKLSWVQSAADLGLDINDAKGEQKKKHAKKEAGRLRKAELTNKKVIKLHTKQAKRKIINTAVLPRVAYSVVARGCAPSTLQRLRGQEASAAGLPAGGCTITFFALTGA